MQFDQKMYKATKIARLNYFYNDHLQIVKIVFCDLQKRLTWTAVATAKRAAKAITALMFV